MYYAQKQASMFGKHGLKLIEKREDCFEPENYLREMTRDEMMRDPVVLRSKDLLEIYRDEWRNSRLRDADIPVLDRKAQDGIRRGLALSIKRQARFEESIRQAGSKQPFSETCDKEVEWLEGSKCVRNSVHKLPTFACGNCCVMDKSKRAPFVWIRDDNGLGNGMYCMSLKRYCLRCHMIPGGRSALFSNGGSLEEVYKQLLPKIKTPGDK